MSLSSPPRRSSEPSVLPRPLTVMTGSVPVSACLLCQGIQNPAKRPKAPKQHGPRRRSGAPAMVLVLLVVILQRQGLSSEGNSIEGPFHGVREKPIATIEPKGHGGGDGGDAIAGAYDFR